MVVLTQGEHSTVWRGATDKEAARGTGANELIHRLAMEEACEAGHRFFHLDRGKGVAAIALLWPTAARDRLCRRQRSDEYPARRVRDPAPRCLQSQAGTCGDRYAACPDSTTPARVDYQIDWVAAYADRPPTAGDRRSPRPLRGGGASLIGLPLAIGFALGSVSCLLPRARRQPGPLCQVITPPLRSPPTRRSPARCGRRPSAGAAVAGSPRRPARWTDATSPRRAGSARPPR
jgi:hypothetical protein